MSKLVYMGSGAIDPIAQSKRVFWRPATPGTALRVGDPVCYKLDAVDHKERTVDPVHLGLTRDTYQEGEQEMTGRLFNVEEPLVDNIDAFAGIVKAIGALAGADGDMIEIWTANSGAVVPANVVLTTTTAGRTILAVMVGTRTLGAPTMDVPDFATTSSADTAGSIDSKVVGIAMESLTAAGLCWVKLDENAFMYQGGQIDQEVVVGPGTVNITVNRAMVKFTNTAGHCQFLHYRALLAGDGTNVGDGQRGVYRFETFLDALIPVNKYVLGIHSHLEFGSDFSTVGGGHVAPLALTIRTKNTDPDLSQVGELAAIHIEWHLRKDTTNPLTNPPPTDKSSMIYINADTTGTEAECFLKMENASNVSGYLSTGTAAFGATDIMIPCVIGGGNYFLVAVADTGL